MMKREFTQQELKNFWSFLVETFEFTEEQTAAIDHQAPMTQEMYNSIMERCMELGEEVEPLIRRMIEEFPEFADAYADEIVREAEAAGFPDLSPEESEKMREGLYAKIRAKYGENAI